MTNSILLVEDDKVLQKHVKELLLDNGYNTHVVSDSTTALTYLKKIEPDIVLLDLEFSTTSGKVVYTQIRNKYHDLPIIIMTTEDSIANIVQELNLGANDYITKPFISEEFVAKINTHLRNTTITDTLLKVADLELNTKTLSVKRAGKPIQLTPQEFKLLHYFMSNKDHVLTREMILNRIWQYASDVETRVVDVYMGYLRKKIDKDSSKKLLHSIRGFGYVLKE